MRKFLSCAKTVALIVGRCGLLVVGAVALELLFVAVWTEWFLRRLYLYIFVALPDKYRRILLLMVTPPPQCVSTDSQAAAK